MLNELRVMNLKTENGMLKEMMTSERKITYAIKPPNHTAKIITFSDESHRNGKYEYGKTEEICGLQFATGVNCE